MSLPSTSLEGEYVRLVPITRACLPQFRAAALSAPSIWEHIPVSMRTEADIDGMFESALAQADAGQAITFSTRWRASGAIIGGTSIKLVNPQLPSLEIGFTWILPAWQRSAVNTEAKLLQLAHAFDVLGCQRVEFKTDVRNLRSRAAIARLGATQEGIVRAERRRLDGSLRDSVLFSILASEWPSVREALRTKLLCRAS